ncbi:GH25 family lysozyme [Anaerofustis sp.]|uniref:GH25 family lysozyme n=1 Tax=Anaerofustis sp. TaxID=1872517 RepID=UPI0025BB8DB2|nr:GH25 family lysozyme [Anaerofustis sp.]
MKKILSFITVFIFAMNILIGPVCAMANIDEEDVNNKDTFIQEENTDYNEEIINDDTEEETERNQNKEVVQENIALESSEEEKQESDNKLTEGIDTAKDDPEQFRARGEISGDFYSSRSMRSASSGIKSKSPFTGKTYLHNSRFKDYTIVHGIDVSVWNGTINWSKVKSSGVKYAFIRVAGRGYGKEGTIFDDSKFKRNITEAKKYGIKVGVYFFSQAINTKEAREEANYTISKIKNYKLDLPVIMDYEYAGGSSGRLTKAKLSKTAATNIVLEFCKTVKSKGYTPMLYANYSMLNNSLNKSSIDKSYKVWLAHYASSTSYSGKYEFWQYASNGKVSGISGDVDVNFWYTKVNPSYSAPKFYFYSSNESKIKLTWKKPSKVDGYRIYRYNTKTKKYDILKDITNANTLTITDTHLKSATTYAYKIRSFYYDKDKKRVYSEASPKLNATTDPKKVSTLKVTTSDTNKINLTWTKVSGASGYRLYKYSSKKKAYVYYKNVKSNKYQDRKVSKNKTYKYRVRAYRTLSGKNYYGEYSPTLKAKAVKKTYISMKKKTAKVKANELNVRTNAGTSYKVVTRVTKNKKVTAYGYKNDKHKKRWYKITFKKGKKTYRGYVHSKYLKF